MSRIITRGAHHVRPCPATVRVSLLANTHRPSWYTRFCERNKFDNLYEGGVRAIYGYKVALDIVFERITVYSIISVQKLKIKRIRTLSSVICWKRELSKKSLERISSGIP